ncbi:SIMPL domain-containing protein [Streptomyces sp. enrichment culture]|uniref:SIMPL domain-containing protein n=1 Tax=Streptomyces sp. enrichment culture TaxID=1795815 RepID=UPI003F559E62
MAIPHDARPAARSGAPGTPAAPHLTVRGEARFDVAPELARLDITVGARDRDRRATLDALTRRNAAALDLVRSCGDGVERLETGSLTVTPELGSRGRGERVRGYHGTVRLAAELSDFAVLGDLAARLADLDLTRVDGLRWSLRPDSPAHRRARQEAVHDAVRRAREYAEALGTALDALVELTDTGVPDLPPETFAGTAPRGFARSAADEEPPPLDLEPQRRRVQAEVTARFTLVPPEL